MKSNSGSWIRKAGTLAAVFIVILMSIGTALAKERKHGKELVIQKTSGEIIGGELIAVKGGSLLIDSKSSSENLISICDVRTIIIINGSQSLSDDMGVLSGVALGMGIGTPARDDKQGSFRFNAEQKTTLDGVLSLVISGIVGGILGAKVGADEMIEIKEAGDPSQIPKLLQRLRDLSRYPDEK
jgi:hypothetical protein